MSLLDAGSDVGSWRFLFLSVGENWPSTAAAVVPSGDTQRLSQAAVVVAYAALLRSVRCTTPPMTLSRRTRVAGGRRTHEFLCMVRVGLTQMSECVA